MSSSISSSESVGDWRRFFRLVVGTVAIIIGVIYAFVVLVDPWDALPLSPPLDRAPVTSNQRFAYPALARSARFDSAVFGTSTSRLLRPSALNAVFDARFANLAMNAATAYEQLRLMDVFLRAHPRVRRLLIGIDVPWCEVGDAVPQFTPRAFPAWMYERTTWRGYREMLNMYAIQEAGKEFGVLTHLKKEDQGRDGYTIFVPPDESYDRERAAANLRGQGPFIPPGNREGPPSRWLFTPLDALRPVLAALPRETAVILFFVPFNRAKLAPPGSPGAEVWDECKRRVARLAGERDHVLAVDFLRPSPITNDDEGYWDGIHFRVAVADRVVRDLAGAARGEESPDYEILYRSGTRP